jgi:hypothetical protein
VDAARDRLLWTLRWLAAEPEKALSVARDPRIVPEELAEDLHLWLYECPGAEDLRTERWEAAFEIDRALDRMSDHPGLWTTEAFATDPEWTRLRERARVLLSELGVDRADDHLAGNVL